LHSSSAIGGGRTLSSYTPTPGKLVRFKPGNLGITVQFSGKITGLTFIVRPRGDVPQRGEREGRRGILHLIILLQEIIWDFFHPTPTGGDSSRNNSFCCSAMDRDMIQELFNFTVYYWDTSRNYFI
jgi:hypothetical protein